MGAEEVGGGGTGGGEEGEGALLGGVGRGTPMVSRGSGREEVAKRAICTPNVRSKRAIIGC